MKRTISLLTAILAVSFMLSSCSMTSPVCATSNPVGNKVGMASGNGYLGALIFDVDASIRTAAKNGGITKISTVDWKWTNILGLLQTYTCIVSGE